MIRLTASKFLIFSPLILISCSAASDFRPLKAQADQFPQSFSELTGVYETVDSRNDKPYGITRVVFDNLTYDQILKWQKNPQFALSWPVLKSVKPTALVNSTYGILEGNKTTRMLLGLRCKAIYKKSAEYITCKGDSSLDPYMFSFEKIEVERKVVDGSMIYPFEPMTVASGNYLLTFWTGGGKPHHYILKKYKLD